MLCLSTYGSNNSGNWITLLFFQQCEFYEIDGFDGRWDAVVNSIHYKVLVMFKAVHKFLKKVSYTKYVSFQKFGFKNICICKKINKLDISLLKWGNAHFI